MPTVPHAHLKFKSYKNSAKLTLNSAHETKSHCMYIIDKTASKTVSLYHKSQGMHTHDKTASKTVTLHTSHNSCIHMIKQPQKQTSHKACTHLIKKSSWNKSRNKSSCDTAHTSLVVYMTITKTMTLSSTCVRHVFDTKTTLNTDTLHGDRKVPLTPSLPSVFDPTLHHPGVLQISKKIQPFQNVYKAAKWVHGINSVVDLSPNTVHLG